MLAQVVAIRVFTGAQFGFSSGHICYKLPLDQALFPPSCYIPRSQCPPFPGHALLKPKPIHMVQRSQIPDSLDIQYQVYFWICDTCDNARQSSAIISNIITSTGINAFLPVSSRTVSFNAKDIQVQKDVFTQNIAFAYALLKKHICNNRDTFQKQYNKIHYQGKGRSLLSSRTALTCLRAGGPGARKGELRFFPALLARDRSWSQPA